MACDYLKRNGRYEDCVYHTDGGQCIYCGETVAEQIVRQSSFQTNKDAELSNRIAKAAAKSIVGSDPELERIKKGIKNCDLTMQIDGRTMAEWGWTTFEDRPSQKWDEVNDSIRPEKFCEHCGMSMDIINGTWVCVDCIPVTPFDDLGKDPSKVFYD